MSCLWRGACGASAPTHPQENQRRGWSWRPIQVFAPSRTLHAGICDGPVQNGPDAEGQNNATQIAVKLFLCDSTELVRTPEGEALFQRIKASFDDIAQAVDTVSPEACRTRMTVSATTFIANYLIQQIPKSLRNDYPDVNLIFRKFANACLWCYLAMRQQRPSSHP